MHAGLLLVNLKQMLKWMLFKTTDWIKLYIIALTQLNLCLAKVSIREATFINSDHPLTASFFMIYPSHIH